MEETKEQSSPSLNSNGDTSAKFIIRGNLIMNSQDHSEIVAKVGS
jgi:hypothetical protein